MESRKLRMGQYNRLKVIKELDFGIYLDGHEDEILVPVRYVPEGTEIGDFLDVFIYRDSEDRIIATTLEPLVSVGEFAYLKVVDVTEFGVFLDWGLPKDLFVPIKQQRANMKLDDYFFVFAFLDSKTDRVLASAKVEDFMEEDTSALSDGMEVDIVPYEYTDMGIKALVNQRYLGVLYRDEIFRDVVLGQALKGFVKKVRDDKKIDLALVEQSYGRITSSKSGLYEKLIAADGFLPFTDKSEPTLIYNAFGVSKKDFKKSVGALFKEGKIRLESDGIYLLSR